MKKDKFGFFSSFPRRRESSSFRRLAKYWIPVFTGMTIFFLVFQFPGFMLFTNNFSTAYAQGDWKQEFAEVCGNTQNVMELSPDELRSHIDRCTRLEERLDQLSGPQGSERKVYATRLKMCKDLYVYTLEFREKEEQGNGE